MQVENVDCVDALYVVYVDESLDVVEDVECVQVGYAEYVDEWLEVIEDVDCMQVDDIDCVDERLEEIEDVVCMHVDDDGCIFILYVDLQCWHDDVEDKEIEVEGRKDVDEKQMLLLNARRC